VLEDKKLFVVSYAEMGSATKAKIAKTETYKMAMDAIVTAIEKLGSSATVAMGFMVLLRTIAEIFVVTDLLVSAKNVTC